MKKGFFELENNDVDDFFKNLKINNKEVDVSYYLNGICHEFALGLNEMLGYDIVLWVNYDEDIDCNILIHAFNTFQFKGNKYYVDIRGITDDINDITDGFDYFEELNDFSGYNIIDAKGMLKELGINTDINRYFYEIFDNNKTYYQF